MEKKTSKYTLIGEIMTMIYLISTVLIINIHNLINLSYKLIDTIELLAKLFLVLNILLSIFCIIRINKKENVIQNIVNIFIAMLNFIILFIFLINYNFLWNQIFTKISIAIIIIKIVTHIFLIDKIEFAENKRAKRNKYIVIVIIIALIFTIYFAYKKATVVKVAYEIHELDIYSWIYQNDMPMHTISSQEELDGTFDNFYNSIVGRFEGINEEYFDKAKESLIEEFNIDESFFDNYFLICGTHTSGNIGDELGLDYIEYNKIKNKLELIQEVNYNEPLSMSSPAMGDSYAYFIKIEKKYEGELEWGTRYVPF